MCYYSCFVLLHQAVARRMVLEAGFSSFDELDWGSTFNQYYVVKP
jgi:hypothetical protein